MGRYGRNVHNIIRTHLTSSTSAESALPLAKVTMLGSGWTQQLNKVSL